MQLSAVISDTIVQNFRFLLNVAGEEREGMFIIRRQKP